MTARARKNVAAGRMVIGAVACALLLAGLSIGALVSIAVYARRVAVAVEKLAGDACVSRPLPGLVVHGRCSSTEGRHDR